MRYILERLAEVVVILLCREEVDRIEGERWEYSYLVIAFQEILWGKGGV